MSPTQAMDRKQKEGSSFHSKKEDYEDYEDGKLRDKKQKKLTDWIGKNGI